jgi:hypothetical protein
MVLGRDDRREAVVALKWGDYFKASVFGRRCVVLPAY